MCGIAALVHLRGEDVNGDVTTMARMLDAQKHRGPDGAGVTQGRGAVLGHRRLAIIDLSDSGRQPLVNEDGSVHVVCNGEIYNYLELREELINRGHRFSSHSDSEILVHGYEQWDAEGLLKRLRGMFAFVLWDDARRRVVAGRDRMGQKPVYYHLRDGDRLAVASELKALLQVPGVERRVDLEALLLCMQLSYVPEGHCIFQDIHKLPPAHYLEIEKGRASVRRYWTAMSDQPPPRTPEDAQAAVQALLSEATSLQLRSDVPVGVFLSGGIDSSLVTLTAMQGRTQPLRAMSVKFPGLQDESSYARKVATYCGADYVELEVVPQQLPDLLRDVVCQFDEPLLDSSVIPTYCISAAARREVKVVLSGDGGDELFGGYSWYQEHLTAESVARNNSPQSRAAFGLVSALRPFRSWIPGSNARFLRPLRSAMRGRAVAGLNGTMARHERLVALGPGRSFLSEDLRTRSPRSAEHFFADRSTTETSLSAVRRFDLEEYLPGDILRKVDAASMAHGLEVRSPFMDHHLVEYVMAMPPEWNVNLTSGKIMPKELLSQHLPRALIHRPKEGFGLPLAQWLRSPELRPIIQDALVTSKRPSGLWDPDRVADAVRGLFAGDSSVATAVWSVLMLELWALEYQPQAA